MWKLLTLYARNMLKMSKECKNRPEKLELYNDSVLRFKWNPTTAMLSLGFYVNLN